MKYGELKIECLAVMDEINEPIILDNLNSFEEDDSYKDLFARMPGAINRAMDRIANKKKLPLKSSRLVDGNTDGCFTRFFLSELPEYRSIKRVSYSSMYGYYPSIDFIIEGDVLMIPREYSDGVIIAIYYPKAPTVNFNMDNNDELNIPDELARIIPYYVKSDLMARDEAELASLARNKFESALDEINLGMEDSFGVRIEKVYGI